MKIRVNLLKINNLGKKRGLFKDCSSIVQGLFINCSRYCSRYYAKFFKLIIFSQSKKLMNKGLHNFSYLRNLFIFNNLLSFDGSKMFQFLPYRENAQIRCVMV